jgi:hypothetical protein
MEQASAVLGLLQGAETAALGWWHAVFVTHIMQQQHSEFPHCSGLLWTRSTGAEGLADLGYVHQQLLPCLILRPREEGTDKRFDRLTGVSIVQRADGPARYELLLKLLFPPFRWPKEGNKFVRNVLQPSAAELPQDVAQFVICIHGRESSRVGTFPFREHESSMVHVCDTTTTKHNFRAPVIASRRSIMSENRE